MSSFPVAGGIHWGQWDTHSPWWESDECLQLVQPKAAGLLEVALWLCTQGQAGVGVKHGCSSLLHRNVAEERQERQEL